MKEKLYIVSLDDHFEHEVYAVVGSEEVAVNLVNYIKSYYDFTRERRKKILDMARHQPMGKTADGEIDKYYKFLEKSEKEWFLDKGLEPVSEVWTGCSFCTVNYLEEIKW